MLEKGIQKGKAIASSFQKVQRNKMKAENAQLLRSDTETISLSLKVPQEEESVEKGCKRYVSKLSKI